MLLTGETSGRLSSSPPPSSSHLLHDVMENSTHRKRLKSRRPLTHHSHQLVSSVPPQETVKHWPQTRWAESWASTTTRLHRYMPTPSDSGQGVGLSRNIFNSSLKYTILKFIITTLEKQVVYVFPESIMLMHKNIIRHNLIQTINNTPNIIIDKMHTHNLRGFLNNIKVSIFGNYEDHCHVSNCYICKS